MSLPRRYHKLIFWWLQKNTNEIHPLPLLPPLPLKIIYIYRTLVTYGNNLIINKIFYTIFPKSGNDFFWGLFVSRNELFFLKSVTTPCGNRFSLPIPLRFFSLFIIPPSAREVVVLDGYFTLSGTFLEA